MGLLDDWWNWQRGQQTGAAGLLDVPPPRGHLARIRDAFGQSLRDVADLPLPAANLRQAVFDGLMNQVMASPTNEGEAEALREYLQRLKIDAEMASRNARRDQ